MKVAHERSERREYVNECVYKERTQWMTHETHEWNVWTEQESTNNRVTSERVNYIIMRTKQPFGRIIDHTHQSLPSWIGPLM